MRVSVVVATYNGEKYILEQLDSIRLQEYRPDEVLIKDDCSTDKTCEIIAEYIKKYNLSNWKLLINKENIGYKKNFKEGFDVCQGDYIFPCDQDDIWKLDKISSMVSIMDQNDDIGLLVSNYDILYDKNGGKSHYDRKSINDGSIKKIIFDEKWHYCQRPGCTYCFRREFYQKAVRHWNEMFAHDMNLWLYGIGQDMIYLYQQSMIFFRRHGDNATETRKVDTESRIREIEHAEKKAQMMIDWILEEKEKRQVVNQCISFFKIRKKMIKEKKLHLIFTLLRYKEYYSSMKGFALDIYVSLVKKEIRF